MLFYTSKNQSGEIEATYNGRFVFIPFRGNNWVDFEWLRTSLQYRPWKRRYTDLTQTERIVVHEYVHKNVFPLSETGLILNGMRSVVRLCFLFFRNSEMVKKHYRMRTIYLMETLSYHEELAHAIDDELSLGQETLEKSFKKLFGTHQKKKIADAELRIKEKWSGQGNMPTGFQARFYKILGGFMQSRFTGLSLCYSHKKEAFIESYSSLYSRADTLEPKGYLIRFVNRTLRIALAILASPLNKLESFNRYFEWYWIGQRTQFETLQEYYENDFPLFRDNVIRPTAMFIMDWVRVPVKHHHILIEFTEDTLLMDRQSFIQRWSKELKQWKKEPHFVYYLKFFYIQGN